MPIYSKNTNTAYLAMARSNLMPEVFVSMDSEGGTRSVFNGVQTYDGKGDINDPSTWKPTNKGISTPTKLKRCPCNTDTSRITGVGQIFYQTELPVLMRNPNTQKITAYKKNDQGDYEFTTRWDASLPTSDVSKPFSLITQARCQTGGPWWRNGSSERRQSQRK